MLPQHPLEISEGYSIHDPYARGNCRFYYPEPPIEDCKNWIDYINPRTAKELLIDAARKYRYVDNKLRVEVRRCHEEYAEIARKEIARKEASEEAIRSYIQTIREIERRCVNCRERSGFAERLKDLNELCIIGEKICGEDRELRHEVVEHFKSDEGLTDAMLEIVRTLTPNERRKIAKSRWRQRLEKLADLAYSKHYFGDRGRTMQEVCNALDEEEEQDEDEESTER